MTVALLEAQVFAKPYFRPQNLLVAEQDGKIVGMAHLVPDGPLVASELRGETANLPLVIAANVPNATEIEDALFQAAEAMVRESEAKVLLLGGTSEPGPFYFGLAKASCNRGALVSDARMMELAERSEMSPSTSWRVYSRALRGFRPPVDRTQITARRSLNVLREDDPPFASYREACIFMHQHRTCYTLVQKQDGAEIARLVVVELEAFSHLRGVRMSGIVDIDSVATCTQVHAQFFLAETLRQMAETGTAVVETQVNSSNDMLTDVVEKLGFEHYDEVRMMAKMLT
ncbi:hypothetical protein DTL42_18875 [Bremerella cremea]|uniref:GNAT family N-acetyltransferase n=1 Tax=Bremerella cremea TaxID=1031537 RepID=A0A368KM88_9BACT|nr:hypothetical protein [Bremerella cremea]RCS43223.1 hypothetical protein DTL42_18875 [Bremerella cremea]